MANTLAVRVFDIMVNRLDRAGAVAHVMAALRRPFALPMLVVTPNFDHAVRPRGDPRFRGAYAAAEVVLADGFPLVLGSWLSGDPLPERVAGSDLVQPLAAAAAAEGCSIFILGSSLEILAAACHRLHAEHPGLIIAGVYAPGRGFDARHPDNEEAIAAINACKPDLLFVALGSPRQEVWAAAHRHRVETRAILCVGAAFDFLAGRPPRAPIWMQRLCLEWFWRLVHEPGRFFRRYLGDLLSLPLMLLEQAFDHRRAGWQATIGPLPAVGRQQRS